MKVEMTESEWVAMIRLAKIGIREEKRRLAMLGLTDKDQAKLFDELDRQMKLLDTITITSTVDIGRNVK